MGSRPHESLGDNVEVKEPALDNSFMEAPNDKTWEERFFRAQRCINEIDDLLEYFYRDLTVERLRQVIMEYIDEYGEAINEG